MAGIKNTVSVIVSLALAMPHLAQAEGNCFQRTDKKPSYRVFQISGPPTYSRKERDFAFSSPSYPATDYATSMNRLTEAVPPSASLDTFRRHYLLWANRCVFVEGLTPSSKECRNTTRTKGNGYPGMKGGPLNQQLRTVYTTYQKANVCTLIGTKRALGERMEQVEQEGKAAGLQVLQAKVEDVELQKLARRVSLGTLGVEQLVLLDICIVERESIAPDVAGIMLDYEVFDSRTPGEVVAFFRQLRDVVAKHGKTLIVNTNPLPREPNGIDADNVRDILGIVDGFAPTISTGASIGNPDIGLAPKTRKLSPVDSYRSQFAVLTANGRAELTPQMKAKLIWNVSIFDISLAEAQYLHNEVKSQGYHGIMIFRNFVKLGGNCSRESNQVIACLAWGDCSGRFGQGR
jgi:hypothetical protein